MGKKKEYSYVDFLEDVRVYGNMEVVGSVNAVPAVPFSGDLVPVYPAALKTALLKYSWTNAMVAAFGAASIGSLVVGPVSQDMMIQRVLIRVDTPAAGVGALTAQVGLELGTTLEFVLASTVMAAAGTTYGALLAEEGLALSTGDFYLPAPGLRDNIVLTFNSGIDPLGNVTGSTGSVYLLATYL